MRKIKRALILFNFCIINKFLFAQVAGFIAPDTICISQNVNITNTSVSASSYYWNFCVADLLSSPPTGTNLGNPGNALVMPVFSDFVEANGNFYVFVVNHVNPSSGIVRLDFGNSLLNTPTAINLGNFGNILRNRLEGIQVIFENGKWYAFVVGGDPTMSPADIPQFVRVDFGANIQNTNPVVTDLGNIGNMVQPLDLYMFKENNIWHAFTVNKDGSMTRFSFNNGLDNAPVAQNYPLGLNYPTGVSVMVDNGKFYAFVTVALSNTIARLDFGNSLLNNPTVVDLGNPGNTQSVARDITILRFCDAIVGFSINGPSGANANQIVRLDFRNNIESTPSGTLMGNIGNLNFPHSLSKLFRVGDKVYSFITNVNNNTITRLEFPSCTNASTPSYSGQTPPPITYNAPGVYNINLTIDDGLPTQSSLCKQVVVVPDPVHTPLKTIVLPENGSIRIGTSNPSSTYQWFPAGPNADSITVTSDGLYVVETSGYGCSNRDSFMVVKANSTQTPFFTAPDTICISQNLNITNTTTASSYYWNFCVADLLNTPPISANLGNPGNTLSSPVFSDFVETNGNYYLFVVNHFNPSGLVRLDFGSNPLNSTPTAINLGNFGNILNGRLGGIQVIFDNGKWYAFVVGGNPTYGETPQIVRIDFGANIQNTNPVVTNLGNIGGMDQPFDLYMFKENGEWHAFTVNQNNGSMTRFYFKDGLDNPPLPQNIPLVSDYLTGVTVMNDNGNFYAFVTTLLNNSLLRLDFGNSLLNNPTITDYGTLGNVLSTPRDITILRFCDAIVGFIVNGQQGTNANQLVRLNFNGNLLSAPTATLLGTPGNLSVPHSLSKLFRVGDKVYSFITNEGNNTITRLEFPSCTNASTPSYTGQTPPPITYNAPGVYNINLTIDDGLPTQSSFCKQVVVVPDPVHTPLKTIVLPENGSIKIGTSNPSSIYQWFPAGPNADSITVTSDGLYVVETSGYGCSNRDSFMVVRQTNSTVLFTTPDTVCVSTPVNLTNLSMSASSYYWNFCVSNINATTPTGVNLGNIGNQLRAPVFMDYAYYNGNYYGFVVNHNPSSLVRLDFGNSLLNTPVAVPLGNLGGVIQTNSWGEGIQIIQSGGNWYAIIVGGYAPNGSNPAIIKVEFGTNLANPAPVATNWGNIGNAMSQPIDLHLFQDGNNWYGLSTNAESNTITRFNFGPDFSNPPSIDNLGNVGGYLAYPTGVFAVNQNGDWKVFVVNGGDRTRSTGTYALIRLDFGSSLLNTPTAVNLGNPGNLLQHPRDITILKSCGQIIGLAVNGHMGNSNITKYDFSNDISATPTAVSLGNIGNLSFPHSISQLFREGDNLYAFITNVDNNTITRLQFSGCANSSIPSSTLQTPPPITYNTPGIYNINLTIDDGLPTQSSFCRQVVVVPAPVHTPVKTILLSPGDSVKIGTANISGLYKWNTTTQNVDSITVNLAGLYYVETSGYGCNNVDSFRIVFTTADFSYEQDPCDPLRVTFKNETPGSVVIDWDFGNSQNAPGNPNPVTTYPTLGNYNVTLSITNSSGINESVTKEIAVQVQLDNIVITNDTTICEGTSIQLNAVNALNYCWTPSATLSATNIASPIATPLTTTTYYLNSSVVGNNLIVNGDFSAGNTGFTSGYNYVSANTTEGEYYVGSNPGAWNLNFQANCPDHSGSGNMMLANGNPTADINVWSQTVTVTPNTNYAFSTWIQSLFTDNPAQLMFSVNGIPIGNMITASLPVCNWTQFYATWNSGTSTTAVISIINKNTIVWGNDFALDDISFAPVFIKRDSVTITIEQPVIKTNADTIICEGANVQLLTQGSFASYAWSPASGLSGVNVISPVATPQITTQYIVEGTTSFGCKASDTVNITVIPKPGLSVTNDTMICRNTSLQLNANAVNVSYLWTPATGLSGNAISNPVASPVINTTYSVIVTDLVTGCINADSVRVAIRQYPEFSASEDKAICFGNTVQLNASGGDTYIWTPSSSVDFPESDVITASPNATTMYSVYIAERVCNYDTTINVNVTVNPAPTVIAQKSNDINCVTTTSQLSVTGGDQYVWSPATNLDNANVHNPVASPEITTTFTVKGTNQYGCFSEDSIVVAVTKEGNPLYLVPNAFTPNGDGKNDCLSLRKWGSIQLEEFSVYNRWGERIFYTKNRMDCWDGTYKGIKQPSGTFVYVIRAKTFCGDINRKGLVTLIR